MNKNKNIIHLLLISNGRSASPAVTIITSLIFGWYIYFFNVGIFSGIERFAGIICMVYFLGLYIAMLVTGDFSRYRNIFLISASLLMVPSFINILIGERGTMLVHEDTIINNENPFCHIVFTMTAIPWVIKQVIIFPARLKGHFASVYSMLIIWLAATLLFGRGWCSWVCFYGGWDSAFSTLSPKRRIKISTENNRIRYFNFVMLAFVALASLPAFSVVYCELLCPFKIVTEFEAPTDIFTTAAFIITILTFTGLVIVLPYLTKRRIQCMSFCPFGAMQSLFSRISLFRVRFDKDKCTKCGACAEVCPTLSISKTFLDNPKSKMPLTCTMCGRCMNVCRQGAISYSVLGLPFPAGKKSHSTSSLKNDLKVFFMELVHPRTLFVFSAFLFGTIVSGSFIRLTLKLIFEYVLSIF